MNGENVCNKEDPDAELVRKDTLSDQYADSQIANSHETLVH